MKSIIFDNVQFGYKKSNLIFDKLSFDINTSQDKSNKIVGIMGGSGSGKTTLLRLILGLEKPINGQIKTSPINPIVAYLPQELVLLETLSPLENARYFSHTKFYKNRFDKKIFDDLVDSLDLKKVLENSKSVLKLSGGQKQRLSLLQALSIKPDILLLDEPTTGLDAEVKLHFFYKLKEIAKKYKISEAKVKTRLHRIRKKLRKPLKERGYGYGK